MSIEARPKTLIAISGRGTTMKAVLERRNALPVDIVGVFSSSAKAGGLAKLKDKKLEFSQDRIRVINPYHYKDANGKNDRKQYGEAIRDFMREAGADSIAQLGFIPTMPQEVVENARWVINQHPGPLDPGRLDSVTGEQMDFGGLRGAQVTVARVAYIWATGEEYWTEATVYFVTPDEMIDAGKIVSATRLDIPWATPSVRGWTNPIPIGEIWKKYRDELRHATEDVQKALLPLEHKNVIAALRQFENGKIPEGFIRPIPLVRPGEGREYTLFRAKDFARELAPRGDLIAA
jgi:folate-dependent phosphoribosylglycinamide formyltransferase PurN